MRAQPKLRGSRRDIARNVSREQVPCRLSTMPRQTKTRYMKVSEKDECEIKGDEWKKLSDQAKEPCQKKYEAVKAQCDRETATFLTKRRHQGEGHRSAEEGNAATERVQEGLQAQGCSQKTRWWSLRSAPGREAGGDQEESVGGPQDHQRDQESW